MMRIDLFVTPQEIPLFYTKGRRVVIVDVLRAGTTLCYALQSGAEKIIPVDSIEEAKQILATLDRESSLLAGEQDGQKLEGFDLGNSPSEVQSAGLAGKTIVFVSDDVGPLLSRSMEAVEKLLLSFTNVGAVVDYLLDSGDQELTVICAGSGGRFAMEDALAAGMLIDRLGPVEDDSELNDAARACWILYLAHRRNLARAVRTSAAGRTLREKEADGDVSLALQVDSTPFVPLVRDGRIVRGTAE
ncbi:MAG: 2-phosphosulfolactate phosphatase [Candidatus Eisenbacteria bacterium]|uniref:Probable 2-phosphosulfolactate phosphatase n=1 Tax=Eiseniibacteriota bacterium TaxID=2212470 RepID=A0A956N9P6_UNCEI|nr:2-phosphosulfolactate phosphatase [Candidatus Eisenbacteria bacterium]MCB9462346.1 2-phosphosulfolactate phosphatase [Candidatus Eisenbacteria bacterium]